jgi:hypothetical protein
VRRTVFADCARRLLTLLVFIAVCIVAAPASAADPRVERDAKALQKKAIEEDNLNVNYAAAVKKLQSAVTKCGNDRCSASLKAALLRDLGAMQLLSGNVDGGKANFALAVRLDASLDLDPAYKNPMLEGIWTDVKSKGGAGAAPSAPAGGSSGGAPASGDFTHTPPPEALVRTPLAIYVEYSGSDALGRVIVKYKGAGSSDWKTLKLKKVGDGFGAFIPCGDVRQGSLQYFIQGFDAQNQAAAMSGSRTAPFTVEVKAEIAGDVPSLPGKPPPTQCKDKGNETECPPDFPGCAATKKDIGDDCDKAAQCSSGACTAGKCAEQEKKAAGDKCDADDECSSGTCADNACSDKKGSGEYCENDNQCASGSCDDSKCTEAKSSSSYRRFWVGVGAQLDLYVLKAATDVCLRNPAGTNANTAGYTCVDPGSNAQFPPDPTTNSNIQPGQGTPNSGGGIALGNIRVLASFDFALSQNMLIGFRGGYVARTDPAVGSPGAAFAPVHLEARFTYLFGDKPLSKGAVSFMAFGAVGAGEFDAFVPVTVQLSSPAPPTSCTSGVTNSATNQQRCSENAWITAGPVFAALGAGARFRLGDAFALPVALKLEGAFGGRAGFLFGLAPELAIQYGF